MGHWASQEHGEDRFCAGCGYIGCARDLHSEIERLRAALEEIRASCDDASAWVTADLALKPHP